MQAICFQRVTIMPKVLQYSFKHTSPLELGPLNPAMEAGERCQAPPAGSGADPRP